MIIIVWTLGLSSVFAKTPDASDELVRHYAEYMNVSDTMLRIPDLYVAIHEWIGVPYRYGRSDKKGTDCSGFVRNVFLPLCGEELPRSASDMSRMIQAKPIAELKEGDLVFFNFRERSNSHVGIYLQKGWFVHASIYRGVTLNNLHTPYYTRYFSKGGSLKRGELKDILIHPPKTREETPPVSPLIPIPIENGRLQVRPYPQTSNNKI